MLRVCMHVSTRLIFVIGVKYIYPKIYHFNLFKVYSSVALVHSHCCATNATIRPQNFCYLPDRLF